MSKLFNRAKMTTTTAGTGNLTLGSAADGFVTFAAAGVVNGDVVRYCIEAENGTDFEVGQGTYTASGTVLSRADADVQLSSNSNNRITLAAGTHNVFITAADSDFTQEITVTVAGGKFVIDGTSQQIITLLPSITYRLDQSDSTNASHPLVLASGSADGSTYSTGVRTVGTPGSKGAYTEVKLEQDAPALWYKCSSHSGMGASVNTGAPSGGVTSVANQSAMLALSSPSVGDMVYRQDNYKLMMYNGSGWYAIATINTSPTVSSVSQTTDGSTSTIAANGTFAMTAGQNTVVTVTGADAEEGTTLTYSATVTSGTQSNVLASLSQSSNVFTLAPVSSGAGGTITIRFDVSDSAAVGNQSASFSISFAVLNSRYTSLLLHAAAAGTNSTFTDSSSSGHTITVNGDPTQGSFSPYRASAKSQNTDLSEYNPTTHGGSIEFDSSDYFSFSSLSDFEFGTNPWTINFWFYADTQSNNFPSIFSSINYGVAGSSSIRWDNHTAANKIYMYTNGVGDPAIVTTNTLSLSQWHYVCVTRENSTDLKIYVNGSADASVTISASQTFNFNSSGTQIGRGFSVDGAASNFVGFLADLRIIKGTGAVQTSVPTAPLSAVTNTKLLISGQGAKVFDKSQNANLTLSGNTTGHATTKFSGAFSTYFDGSGDNARCEIEAIGTQDYTVEGFFKPNMTGTYSGGVFQLTTSYLPSNHSGIGFGFAHPGTVPYIYTNSTYTAMGSTALTNDGSVWYYFVMARSGGNTKCYIDGAQVGNTITDNNNLTGTYLNIGGWYSSTYEFKGWVQDLRITKGLARYSGSSHTVPTAPLQG